VANKSKRIEKRSETRSAAEPPIRRSEVIGWVKEAVAVYASATLPANATAAQSDAKPRRAQTGRTPFPEEVEIVFYDGQQYTHESIASARRYTLEQRAKSLSELRAALTTRIAGIDQRLAATEAQLVRLPPEEASELTAEPEALPEATA